MKRGKRIVDVMVQENDLADVADLKEDRDLCLACTERLGASCNLDDPGADFEPYYEVCDGCGPGWFTRDGRKLRDATSQELNLIRLLFGGVI